MTVPLFHATGLFSGFLAALRGRSKSGFAAQMARRDCDADSSDREDHDARDRAGNPQGPAHSSQIRRLRPVVPLAGRRSRGGHARWTSRVIARQTRHREPVGGLRDDRDRVGVRDHERSGVRSQTHGRRDHFTDHRPPRRRRAGNALPSGRTAKYNCGASPSPPDTGNATTSPKRRSPPTAGYAPATWATSTTTVSYTSPGGSRKS